MSDSPKPSAPAGISGPPVEVDMPAGLVFEAADYTPVNTSPAVLVETRRKVARHRSKMKATVSLLMEDLNRVTAGLHAADRQGNAAPHWDSAVVLVGKLETAVLAMADMIEKAEARYEASCLEAAAENGAA